MSGLTLLVLTRNEAPRLGDCLASFQSVADEILVVDSQSTDGTIEVARAFGAKVLVREFPGRAAQTRWAIEQIRTEWFFQADADERSSVALNAELETAITDPAGRYAGYTVDRVERFMGREIRCGWHGGILRLCRTAGADMPFQRAHAHLTVDGPVGALRSPLLHEVDQSLGELLVKLTERGLLSAEDYYDRGRRSGYPQIVWHPLATFLRLWLLKGGCLDGLPGLVFAGMRTMYCFVRMVRLLELARRDGRCP